MSQRLRFLVIAWLAALVGAMLEWSQIAGIRPWPWTSFLKSGVELALLWSAMTLAPALLLVALPSPRWHLRPASAAAAAPFLAPLVFGVVCLLNELDPLGRLSTAVIALVGLLACATGFLVWRGCEWLVARSAWLAAAFGSVWTWLILLVVTAGLAGLAFVNSRVQTTGQAAAGAANVLWISVDTLRADHVGAYGNAKGLTPTIDTLAREGVVFEDATCPMPLTAPSHVAMLTGLAPFESGVHKNGMPLPHGIASLPGELTRAGYATAAFVSGFPLFERSSHLAGHFTHYDDEFAAHAPLTDAVRQSPLGILLFRLLRVRWHWREPIERAGDETVAQTMAWLKQRPARPFFVFLHLYDVHGAFIPHQPGMKPSRYYAAQSSADRIEVLADPAERAHLEELYAGEVAFADAQVGKVIAWLREQKALDETLVLLTADHGESLGEHGLFYEHISPYHAETHVPLVLRLPKSEHAGLRIPGPVQLQDLPATLRDLLGVSVELPGTSLAGTLGSGRIPRRLLFASSMSDFENAWRAVSVRDGRFKLFRSSAAFERFSSHLVDPQEFLFDVASDPGESRDLLATGTLPEGLDLEQLRSALDEFEKVSAATGPDQIDPELAANLHKLGYTK